MSTVKELISEYGDRLVGRSVRFSKGVGTVIKVDTNEGMIQTVGPERGLNAKWVHYESSSMELLPTSLSPTKTPFQLLDLGFAAAMCRNWEAGIKHGRTADDWQFLPDTDETKSTYVAKILRHLRAYIETEDSAAQCGHAAAIACNANILWNIAGRGE